MKPPTELEVIVVVVLLQFLCVGGSGKLIGMIQDSAPVGCHCQRTSPETSGAQVRLSLLCLS